ncbi:hypothetical protein SDC9_13547 [bioreactor metagenome]|uniref:DUF2993 domain-containing protein n=1 Tax=bioreactor metagenome TaxID=1076179 RepID=A0A644TLU3_9ZZZZ|nr:DUF2993 domain-containing protein [[Clostridium] scindens]MEA4817229.1 DUF2993 domain-containing protein [[Clostridium] scindens]
MPKRLIYLVVFILVLVAAVEIAVPAVISNIVAQGMVSQTGSDSVSAKVHKRPALSMLGGSFDQIALSATNARAGKITFSEFTATLADVQLDMSTLLSKRLVVMESVGQIDVTATIAEAELARYINQSVKGMKNAVVTITPDKIQATSALSFGGFATVGVTIEGKVVVDSQKIKFVTERFMLNNSPVGSIGGAAITEIPLVENNKLPFNVAVRDIVTEKGKIVIHADNRPK